MVLDHDPKTTKSGNSPLRCGRNPRRPQSLINSFRLKIAIHESKTPSATSLNDISCRDAQDAQPLAPIPLFRDFCP